MVSIPPGGGSFLRAVYDVSQGSAPNKKGIEVLTKVQSQIIKSPMAQNAKKVYDAVSPALEKLGQLHMNLGRAYMTSLIYAFFASRPDVAQATVHNLFARNVEKQGKKSKEEAQVEKPVQAKKPVQAEKPVQFNEREQKLRDILQALGEKPSVLIAPNTRLVLSEGGRGFEDISQIVSQAIADLGKDHAAVKAITIEDKIAWGIEGTASEVSAEPPVKNDSGTIGRNGMLTDEQKAKFRARLESEPKSQGPIDYKTWDGQI